MIAYKSKFVNNWWKNNLRLTFCTHFVVNGEKYTFCCYNKYINNILGVDIMTFPERLKHLREEHNVSQTAIARMLRMSRQAYNNYERGIREPNHAIVKELAKYYRVSTDYILGVSDDPNYESLEEITENIGKHIAAIYKFLSKSNKEKLLTYAEILFEHENREFNYKELLNDLENGKITSQEFNDAILKRQSE